MPFNEAGECVFTSEKDKHARITYQVNFTYDKHAINEDITAIEPKDIPNHDLLLGGFPCQPFSNAGKRLGFEDAGNRGTLFFNIVKILHEKKPSMFLLENVPTLRTQNRGKTFERVLEELGHHLQFDLLKPRSLLNYHVVVVKLNSRQFGIPQNRRRLYILGLCRERYKKDFKTIEQQIKKLEKRKYTEINLSGVLCDNPEVGDFDDYVISKKIWASHKRRKRENKNNGKGFGYSLVNRNDLYTRTMSARYYKDGSEILVGKEGAHLNECPRMLFPREAARLQGFPDDFIINKVSRNQIYRQFGNSVCVPLVQEIASVVIPYLGSGVSSGTAIK
jgi:DNA (cytosine-5)-methyltransferase 1